MARFWASHWLFAVQFFDFSTFLPNYYLNPWPSKGMLGITLNTCCAIDFFSNSGSSLKETTLAYTGIHWCLLSSLQNYWSSKIYHHLSSVWCGENPFCPPKRPSATAPCCCCWSPRSNCWTRWWCWWRSWRCRSQRSRCWWNCWWCLWHWWNWKWWYWWSPEMVSQRQLGADGFFQSFFARLSRYVKHHGNNVTILVMYQKKKIGCLTKQWSSIVPASHRHHLHQVNVIGMICTCLYSISWPTSLKNITVTER